MIVASTASRYPLPIPRPGFRLNSQRSDLRTSTLPTSPNSFPCHTSAKFTRNSFRCHTYKFALLQVLSLPHIQKTGGVPLGVRRSCRRFRGRQLSAPISYLVEERYHITSFLFPSQPHLTQELL